MISPIDAGSEGRLFLAEICCDLKRLHTEHDLQPSEILGPGNFRNVVIVMADLCSFSSYGRSQPDGPARLLQLARRFHWRRHQHETPKEADQPEPAPTASWLGGQPRQKHRRARRRTVGTAGQADEEVFHDPVGSPSGVVRNLNPATAA
jgi:hypothetical protein